MDVETNRIEFFNFDTGRGEQDELYMMETQEEDASALDKCVISCVKVHGVQNVNHSENETNKNRIILLLSCASPSAGLFPSPIALLLHCNAPNAGPQCFALFLGPTGPRPRRR